MLPFAYVIDDNRLVANSLVEMLSLLGYEAQAAYGSLPALQVLNQRVPDLIVLDIHMQALNGVDLCRHIRGDPRLSKVPILAISSGNQPALIAGMRAAGANVFLAKPVDLRSLERALLEIEKGLAP